MTAGRPVQFEFTTSEAIEKAEIFGRFRASYATMADYFGCCERTIQREFDKGEESNFCQSYKKALSNTKMRLSESQFKYALEGSVPLLIWLGKQYLDQKDKVENSDLVTDRNINITYEVVQSGSKTQDN